MSIFHGPDHTLGNIAEMMWRLGLTVLSVAQARELDIRSAIDACMTCAAGDVCSDWLARALDRLDQAPAFCPNAGAFMRARRQPISNR
jgi:hypothetical protein